MRLAIDQTNLVGDEILSRRQILGETESGKFEDSEVWKTLVNFAAFLLVDYRVDIRFVSKYQPIALLYSASVLSTVTVGHLSGDIGQKCS